MHFILYLNCNIKVYYYIQSFKNSNEYPQSNSTNMTRDFLSLSIQFFLVIYMLYHPGVVFAKRLIRLKAKTLKIL